MKMRAKSFASALALTILASYGRVAAFDKQQEAAAQFEKYDWAVVRSLDDVNSAVIIALKSRFGADDRIADVGKAFNATDLVDKRPMRRLVLAGRYHTMWFVAYEQGGIGHHLVLVMFDAGTKPPRPVLLARGIAGTETFFGGWRVKVAELGVALRNAKLHIEDPSAQYY